MNKPLRTWKDVQEAKLHMDKQLISQEIKWTNQYTVAQQRFQENFTVANLFRKGVQQFFNVASFKSTSGLALQLGYRVSQFLFKKRAQKKQNSKVIPISQKK